MQITNGHVEYEHPNRIADFVIPKAKVMLSFVLSPDDDVEAALERVGEMARVRAVKMATGAIAALQAPVPALGAPAQAPGAPILAPLGAGRQDYVVPPPAPRSRKTPPGAPPAAPLPATLAAAAAVAPPAPAPVAEQPLWQLAGLTSDPHTTFDVTLVPGPTPAAAASVTSNAAPIGAIPSSVADPRLTNDGLQQAIEQKLAHAADRQLTTNAIRALVTEFTGDGLKRIYVVADPAARAEFLVRLAGL
jgi:hypothetical protein